MPHGPRFRKAGSHWIQRPMKRAGLDLAENAANAALEIEPLLCHARYQIAPKTDGSKTLNTSDFFASDRARCSHIIDRKAERMAEHYDPGKDGFEPIKTKADCRDSRRKDAENSWGPGTIYARLLARLSDEQVHDIEHLFAQGGGAESDKRNKLYYLAHRGKCSGKWTLYRKENLVMLIFS